MKCVISCLANNILYYKKIFNHFSFLFKHESQLYFTFSCTRHHYCNHHLLQSAGQEKKHDERSVERY